MQLVKQRQFPVQWHEGMLLSPQHFQQEQVYRDNERMHQLALSGPYYWGLVSLDYEPTGLLSGKLRLRTCYGIMPDGLVVNYQEKLDGEVIIDLTQSVNLELSGAVATVHLVVPVRDKGAAHQQAEIQRFDSLPSGELVVDENTGENGVEVCRLRPRYSLFVGDVPPSKYISMPLMRVRKENDGTFKATDYVPPLRQFHTTDVKSADVMFTNLERLVQAVRQKAIQLSGMASSDATGLSRTMRAKKRELSEILGSVLPTLELMLSAEVHPFTAYTTFCESIGRLAKITSNPVPPKLPPYDHNDLRSSFNAVIACFANLVNTIKSQFRMLRFDLEDEMFSIELVKQENSDVVTIEVRGEKDATEKSLTEFIQSARIVCQSKLADADQKRLLGARRKVLVKPIFESDSDQERVVVVLNASDPFVRFGERLVITSAKQKKIGAKPESIWLYSA